eukprot:scaffold1837_cov183-Skeletonema_marinoi.AAC.1
MAVQYSVPSLIKISKTSCFVFKKKIQPSTHKISTRNLSLPVLKFKILKSCFQKEHHPTASSSLRHVPI